MDSTSTSSSNSDLQTKLTVTDSLKRISTELVPSHQHYKKCDDTAVLVISLLEHELGPAFRGRVMVTGSYGKGTPIANGSDYDIVIFFPGLLPPFTQVLKNMETALQSNAEKLKGFHWRFRSTIHICFDVDSIRFDIAPAAQLDTSFLTDRWSCFTPSLLDRRPSVQYILTLEKIKELKEPESTSYFYSSSLSIEAVSFVMRQNPFIHSVIRLGKYWAQHVNTGRTLIRGRSVLIEIMAIHCCYSMNPLDIADENLEKAFLTFLKLFCEAQKLRLYVYINYQRADIPDTVFNQTPLVLDPANPFNNLLNPANFPQAALKCYVDAAKTTLQKINDWKHDGTRDLSEFKRIFEFS